MVNSKYVFKYVDTEGKTIVKILQDEDGCLEIVTTFTLFLKAVSFHPTTIKNCLNQAAEDIE